MKLTDWPLTNIGDLAHVYNAQIAAHVPHCYAISPEELQTGIHQKTDPSHVVSQCDERVIVAEDNGHIRGFTHITLDDMEHRGNQQSGGFIHFLTYARGYRAVGQALLQACEEHLHSEGTCNIWAFDGHLYRFHHLGFPLISDHMHQQR